MSDESLRALERAATEAPDDLGVSDRLERAQARAGSPVSSPGRALLLSALAAKLQSYVARALDGTSPDQMLPRRMSCQLFAGCPRVASGNAHIRLRIDQGERVALPQLPAHGGIRNFSPFTDEVRYEGYGAFVEERKYRVCLECFARFQRTYVYPDPTRPGSGSPPRWDGAWVLRTVVEWYRDPDHGLYVRRPRALAVDPDD